MTSIFTNKEILREWCEQNMSTHTDWTGTRVETKNKCESVDDFVDKLFNYLEDNHMGRIAAMDDRRFHLVNSIINGYMAKWGCLDANENDLIEKAIRMADKTIEKLNKIEQKEFEEFRKLK